MNTLYDKYGISILFLKRHWNFINDDKPDNNGEQRIDSFDLRINDDIYEIFPQDDGKIMLNIWKGDKHISSTLYTKIQLLDVIVDIANKHNVPFSFYDL